PPRPGPRRRQCLSRNNQCQNPAFAFPASSISSRKPVSPRASRYRNDVRGCKDPPILPLESANQTEAWQVQLGSAFVRQIGSADCVGCSRCRAQTTRVRLLEPGYSNFPRASPLPLESESHFCSCSCS